MTIEELKSLMRRTQRCLTPLCRTSKPYSTGYYSYAKNYVKSFGIYPFSDEQKQHLLSLTSKEEVDEYLREIYKVAI